MKRLIPIGALLLSVVISTPANAEVSVALYKKSMRDKDIRVTMESYVSGVGRGMWFMNFETHLFCPPGQFIAQGANFRVWIDEAIKKGNPPDDFPIEALLIERLKQVFPCH